MKNFNSHYVSRIFPFFVFMILVGAENLLSYANAINFLSIPTQIIYTIYPVKIIITAILIFYYWNKYNEFNIKDIMCINYSIISLSVGIIVFILWINMNWTIDTNNQPKGYNIHIVNNDIFRMILIFLRIIGSSIIVPIMEEIFWRSFILRYIINSQFTKVPIGKFTFSSFLIGSILFGLEHEFIIAGIMAGIAYSLLLYKTKSIAQCILAHATTNFALGIYVLQTGKWYFW